MLCSQLEDFFTINTMSQISAVESDFVQCQ